MKQSFLFIVICALAFTSCQKKKSAEVSPAPVAKPVVPVTEDTLQTYISPADRFDDRSEFAAENFDPTPVRYRGDRTVHYKIAPLGNGAVTMVLEYISGSFAFGDSVSTVTRLLLYSQNQLVYRKAFPPEFAGTSSFASVRSFDHQLLKAGTTKAILYYWLTVTGADGIGRKEYHAVAMDQQGVTNELTGDLTRIAGNLSAIRFQGENRLLTRIPPHRRYHKITVDAAFTIDWTTCTATMDVPADSSFPVSDQPLHFFNAKTKLFSSTKEGAASRETIFKELTSAQIQRAFVPSLFDSSSVSRDRLFIHYSKALSGWIDPKTMTAEEILVP